MNDNVSMTRVIAVATKACKSFAACSNNFFYFDQTEAWRGWENWLTVEIVRRLNSKDIRPFCSYSNLGESTKKKMDLYIDRPSKIAVEIKVNYISELEIDRWNKRKQGLPDRITDDLKKRELVDQKTYFLMLVSTVLESKQSCISYRKHINADLSERFNHMNWRWYDCSHARGGWNMLLAISDSGRLPSEKTLATTR